MHVDTRFGDCADCWLAKQQPLGIDDPRMSSGEAVGCSRDLQSRGGRVVFTNGVAALHPGHIRYRSDAGMFGDSLIVGDSTIRAIKPADPSDGFLIAGLLGRTRLGHRS